MTHSFDSNGCWTSAEDRAPNFALSVFIKASDAPLSDRLAVAREQFSAMFASGELDVLSADTRANLRGLELFLLETVGLAFALENRDQIHKSRTPRWMRWARL